MYNLSRQYIFFSILLILLIKTYPQEAGNEQISIEKISVFYYKQSSKEKQLAVMYLHSAESPSPEKLPVLSDLFSDTKNIERIDFLPNEASTYSLYSDPGKPFIINAGIYSVLEDMAIDAFLLFADSSTGKTQLTSSGLKKQTPLHILRLVYKTAEKLNLKIEESPVEDFYRYSGILDTPKQLTDSLRAGLPAIVVYTPYIDEFTAAFFSELVNTDQNSLHPKDSGAYFRYKIAGKILTIKDKEILETVLVLMLFLLLVSAMDFPGLKTRNIKPGSILIELISAIIIVFSAISITIIMIKGFTFVLEKILGGITSRPDSFYYYVVALTMRLLCVLSVFYTVSGFASKLGFFARNGIARHGRLEASIATLVFFIISGIASVIFLPQITPLIITASLCVIIFSHNSISSSLGFIVFLIIALPYIQPLILLKIVKNLTSSFITSFSFVFLTIAVTPFLLWIEAITAHKKVLHRGNRTMFLWLAGSFLSALAVVAQPYIAKVFL